MDASLSPSIDVECRSCGAALTIGATERTAVCPYCASPAVVDRPATRDRPTPTFAIGFSVPKDRAQDLVRRWGKRQGPFRRSDLHKAHIEDIRGVYSPAFLYSGTGFSNYRAQIGENYTETQTYTVTINGKTQTRTRTVVKTEWRSLAGQYASYVFDVLVTASRGIANAELEALEPYELGALRRYQPELISGWIAEEATLVGQEALHLARQETVAAVSKRLSDFMPGDTHMGLEHQTWVDNEALDLVLVPLWVLALRYDPKKPPVRVLVNGQTGKIAGKAPLSWIRISLAVLFVLIAIAGFVALYLGVQR